MKPSFTNPKIIHYNQDLSRQWFVYFRYFHEGKWRVKVYKAYINAHKTKKDRMKEAIQLRDALIYKLKNENWNPFGNKKVLMDKPIGQVIDEILATKQSSMKIKSIRTYNDIAKMFKTWLESHGYKYLYPHNFTNILARSYMDYLLVERKYKGKTHNGQLGILKTIFNAMFEREWIDVNPFKGIKELTEEVGKNVAYTDDERKRIRDYLYEYNKRIYYAVQFVYYCFLRRSELIQLKVGDIDFENMTIRISSAVSKNRKQESVTIPKSFEPILYEMKLDQVPKEFYIFGYKFQTCARRMMKPDNLTISHKKALTTLNIRPECSFYSWKHTGCVNLYNVTQDIYMVSRQARHYDISMTMRYMKSLGVIVDEKLRNADFKF